LVPEPSRHCSTQSAFDRRHSLEATCSIGSSPTAAGRPSICLSNYKKIFVIAPGQSRRSMLDTLLSRMSRRLGLRGVCCSNQLPKHRDWRFRYFEGGHPVPNEESFAAARAALAMLRKARKDTLIFFLMLRRGLGHV